jgi:hypothetical protein
MHYKMKNIPIKYHFLQEQVVEKSIIVEYVGTKEQVVDIFTKQLPQEAFEYLCHRLRVIFGITNTTKRGGVNQLLLCLNNYAHFKLITKHYMMITII